jgi:DNA topoisomerase II
MDDSLMDSVFEDGGDSSDFAPAPKAVCGYSYLLFCSCADACVQKSKVVAKKVVAAPKAKAAPKKLLQSTKAAKAAPKKRRKADSDDENSDVDVGMNDSLHDDSLLSNTPPSAKRQKKVPPAKKSSGKPLQEIDNVS